MPFLIINKLTILPRRCLNVCLKFMTCKRSNIPCRFYWHQHNFRWVRVSCLMSKAFFEAVKCPYRRPPLNVHCSFFFFFPIFWRQVKRQRGWQKKLAQYAIGGSMTRYSIPRSKQVASRIVVAVSGVAPFKPMTPRTMLGEAALMHDSRWSLRGGWGKAIPFFFPAFFLSFVRSGKIKTGDCCCSTTALVG